MKIKTSKIQIENLFSLKDDEIFIVLRDGLTNGEEKVVKEVMDELRRRGSRVKDVITRIGVLFEAKAVASLPLEGEELIACLAMSYPTAKAAWERMVKEGLVAQNKASLKASLSSQVIAKELREAVRSAIARAA